MITRIPDGFRPAGDLRPTGGSGRNRRVTDQGGLSSLGLAAGGLLGVVLGLFPGRRAGGLLGVVLGLFPGRRAGGLLGVVLGLFPGRRAGGLLGVVLGLFPGLFLVASHSW